MGITGRHASFHQFRFFVVKCVIYFWRPWQFPYDSPYTVIFIICTALVIWAAIIVGTSLAVRYFCAMINLFKGVFSNWTVFFTVGTWMDCHPVTLHIIPPGKVLATIWTLNHFDVYSPAFKHQLSLGCYWMVYIGVTVHATRSNQHGTMSTAILRN